MKSVWDDAALKLATDYYMEGDTYGMIAHKMRDDGYNFTRNAVLGKLNRKGVADGRTSHGRTGFAKSVARPKPKPLTPPKPKAQPKTEASIQYIGPVENFPPHGGCQYTRDDVAKSGWQMCGHECETEGTGLKKVTLPWCSDHSAMCYAVSKPRAA